MHAETSGIRAVVFDLDDTLFPERQYVRSGYRAIAEALRRQLGTEDRYEDWLWRRFEGGQAAGALDALNGQFHLSLDREGIQRLVRAYREHRPEIRPYEGTAEMLALLRPRLRLGVLSDGYMPAQRLKFDVLGLRRFFDAVVFTEDLGRDAWKPSAAGFEAIREKLDVPHESCAYVADNPAKDFVAPNRLGWRTVRFLHPGQLHARNLAPEDGEPQYLARLPGDLCEALLEPRR